MADSSVKVREVAWNELFPWLMLLRSVRIAMMARVLVLGAAGLIATVIGWSLLTEAFSHSTDPVITFGFVPHKKGQMKVVAQDSNNMVFDHSFDVPGTPAG